MACAMLFTMGVLLQVLLLLSLKFKLRTGQKKKHNIIQTTVVALGRHVSPLKLFYDVKFE